MKPVPEMSLLKWRAPILCKLGKLKKVDKECQIAET
jgi:hypothetical protein